jgi:hypothetical protein
VQEDLLLIEHMGNAVRVAGHLVHVVRNRANNALQLSQLLGQLLGGLGPPVVRGECQALDIGRDREPRGLRPPRNAEKVRFTRLA